MQHHLTSNKQHLLSIKYFLLQYLHFFIVADVIYTATNLIQHRTIDMRGREHGYIVSDHAYWSSGYTANLDKSLTLTGLYGDSAVEIKAEVFYLESVNGECNGYLHISNIGNICKYEQFPLTIQLNSSTNEITFRFVTDYKIEWRRFWLSYTGW